MTQEEPAMTTIAATQLETDTARGGTAITASDWFARGGRVSFDRDTGKIGGPAGTDSLNVWRRVARGEAKVGATWTTFMPGFPDGSFGWAKVDQHLRGNDVTPKLFVEYVGQGDSDKPASYPYGSMERADLVEALWEAEGIESTFLVTFDYSSLVALELLSRQQERIERGETLAVTIEGVLFANGGLFADAHSHPLMTTPILNTPMGGLTTWVGQHSRFLAKQLLGRVQLFSKEYHVTSDELDEIYDAISRRNGFRFLSRGAGFRSEHQSRYAERWDLRRLYLALRESVSFYVVGSDGDVFEPNQVIKSRERLGEYGLDVRMVPGGHLTTSEQPERLARIIEDVAPGSN
jgi:pimeloyl-ACP methyl ester carboxylesterase